MRKIVSTICALMLAALFPLAWMISSGLPADPGDAIAEKYAGWSGVLRAWVFSEWKPGGSLIAWLNKCAADFERAHEGVYIEFTPVDGPAMDSIGKSGIIPPDMLLFSPGVIQDTDLLAPMPAPGQLRSELKHCGGAYAAPVAMGGYILVYNRVLSNGRPQPDIPLPDDDSGRSFSLAFTELLNNPVRPSQTAAPEAGLDLGLPANAAAGDLFKGFINGEVPVTVFTQAEIARLMAMDESGRGPDWACAISGEYALADQLLMAAAIETNDEDRRALSIDFIHALCGDDAQRALADIGAFSVTGRRVHAVHSGYAALDELICSRRLRVTNCFSE